MKAPRLNTPKARPALRLVSTKAMSREQWLKVRQTGIGASDAAAAVGLNPYQSQLELWMIKTGREDQLPSIDPEDDSTPMYWGHILEPIVATHYTKRTGHKVRRVNSVLQHPDKDKAWMLANLDYSVVGASDVQILECKTAGEFGARLWRDGVPEYVECQVQHQLAVTGKAAADVRVLLCGQEIQIHRIERDEALIERLIELERRFWEYVETDTPPPADGSESAGAALRYLYPHDDNETVDLTDDPHLCNVFDQLVTARHKLKTLEKQESLLKQTLQQVMGEASRATFAKGSISWKRSKDSQVLDIDAVQRDLPELMREYRITRPGSRRFLIRS
ncbi:YqaJ viral recombinase family protein [Marinimicrobium agarilyticum]|uniref:YqaJ viral recombinase family nuclease n=1 Tax=Marinimicrobium agarilyticum TaxID=306546 RepID=UPI0004280D83|nr:YqaJ viral recombinase family protein [Marinimicrobium agarilyticum]